MRRDSPPPLHVGLLGLLLFFCAALPFDPDSGTTVVSLIVRALGDDWLSGLMLAITVGLPFGFGLSVAVHVFLRGRFGYVAIKAAAMLLLLEVSLLALLLAHEGEGLAPWALLGVSGSALLGVLTEQLQRRVHPGLTPISFYIRWGALLIAATFGWLRLQFIGNDAPGACITATAVCAALLAGLSRRRTLSPSA